MSIYKSFHFKKIRFYQFLPIYNEYNDIHADLYLQINKNNLNILSNDLNIKKIQ